MNDASATALTVGEHRLVLRGGRIVEAGASLGIETVAAHFRHAPPTGVEIERAIDAIEDALMATRLGQSPRGLLTIAGPAWRPLPGLTDVGDSLDLEQVESLFQRLAAVASGRPAGLGDLAADRHTAAGLLILRETMHHLGFERVQRVASA